MRALLSIVLLACLFFSCDQKEPQEKLDLKSKPMDLSNFKLSYPDQSIDLKEYKKAIKKVDERRRIKTTDFEWSMVGPTNIGGRINCIEVHPDNEQEILVGNSTGGVFRTVNGGDSWEPIADELSYLSVGAIAYDPNNPEIIFIGSGDPNIGGIPHPGNGVYRSTDGGETWSHVGLEEERIISKILIDPNNPQLIYAGAMGLPYEENTERGLYKSADSGDSWEQVLFVSESAGIIDLLMDFNDSNVLYASSWNRIRNNTISVINGPDAHIYKSVDAGENWTLIENGLPIGDKGRIGLAMSGINSNVIFSVLVGLDSQLQGIYKSEDAGLNWTEIAIDEGLMFNALGGFGWYFGQIRVNPNNDDEITLLGVDMFTTSDSGQSWFQSVPNWWTYEVHADKHDLVYLNDNSVLLATDGGLYKSTQDFDSWVDIDDIPNTQFYRIALNPNNPGFYTGGAQDNGTTTGNLDLINDWSRDFGGDGFQAIYDPIIAGLMYVEIQNGVFYFSYDGYYWEEFNFGIDPEDRRNWDSPFIMSSHDNEILYTGTYRVYKNSEAPFDLWESISPDLTDGVIFGQNFHTISTVAESEVTQDLLYAGTTDGNVWVKFPDNSEWEEITEGLPDRYVTNIKTSKTLENTVFVCHSGFKDNDQTAHLHMSQDNGASWSDITGDLPEQPINHIELINDSVFFIGTDFGVYFTTNQGQEWERIGNNMPLFPVPDIEIDTFNNQLIAGTFARSIWTFPLDSLDWVEEEVSDTTMIGINENDDLDQNLVFPNPVVHSFQIQNAEPGLYQIYSSQGQLVKQIEIQNELTEVGVSELEAGLYFINRQGETRLTRVLISK